MEVIWFYINENIPCRVLNPNILHTKKSEFSLEFSLRNWKWLGIGLYKPANQNKRVLDNRSEGLTNLAVRYDNFILLRDFKLTVGNKTLEFRKCNENINMLWKQSFSLYRFNSY